MLLLRLFRLWSLSVTKKKHKSHSYDFVFPRNRPKNLKHLKYFIINYINVHNKNSEQGNSVLEDPQWNQNQCDYLAPLKSPPCLYLSVQVWSSAIPVVRTSLVINFQIGSRGSSIACKAPQLLVSLSVDYGGRNRYQFCLRVFTHTNRNVCLLRLY